jgi:hypothetical protein
MKQEVAVKNFIHNQLKIDENIELHVAHRLHKRRDGRPRIIVAKFEKRKDRERVLGIVKTGILRRTDVGVNEQYPEIINRSRQALVPKMHEERRKDNRAFINYDKLYINGVEYRPPQTDPSCAFFNLETQNLMCAFPLLETRTTTINRTGKQKKRLMKMPQGLKNRNLIFQK